MWLSRNAEVRDLQGLVASAVLIFVIYAVQDGILFRIGNDHRARSIYSLIVAATVPVCWGISPNWHNPQCFPIATFLGWPVTVHAVPLWSFHRGCQQRFLR